MISFVRDPDDVDALIGLQIFARPPFQPTSGPARAGERAPPAGHRLRRRLAQPVLPLRVVPGRPARGEAARAERGPARRGAAARLRAGGAPGGAAGRGATSPASGVVLLTHSHPDHTSPAALLWRSWAARAEPLVVVGPPDAVAAVRGLGRARRPGDPACPSSRRRRRRSGGPTGGLPLPRRCRHPRGATRSCGTSPAPTGPGCSTPPTPGPSPGRARPRRRGRAYDLVLLEETFGERTDHGTGHLDLSTFPGSSPGCARSVPSPRPPGSSPRTCRTTTRPPPSCCAPAGARGAPRCTPTARRSRSPGRRRRGAADPGRRPAPPHPGPRRGPVRQEHPRRAAARRPGGRHLRRDRGHADGDADWDARVAAHRTRRPARGGAR